MLYGGRAFVAVGFAVLGVVRRWSCLVGLGAVVVLAVSGPAGAGSGRDAHVADVPGPSWSGVVSFEWTSTLNVPGLTEDWDLVSKYHFDGTGGLTGSTLPPDEPCPDGDVCYVQPSTWDSSYDLQLVDDRGAYCIETLTSHGAGTGVYDPGLRVYFDRNLADNVEFLPDAGNSSYSTPRHFAFTLKPDAPPAATCQDSYTQDFDTIPANAGIPGGTIYDWPLLLEVPFDRRRYTATTRFKMLRAGGRRLRGRGTGL